MDKEEDIIIIEEETEAETEEETEEETIEEMLEMVETEETN